MLISHSQDKYFRKQILATIDLWKFESLIMKFEIYRFCKTEKKSKQINWFEVSSADCPAAQGQSKKKKDKNQDQNN